MVTPPTLLSRPPRAVRPRSTGGLGCAVLIAAPFLLLGLGFASALAVRLWVQRSGTPVTVVVDGIKDTVSGGRHRTTYHRVRYHYDWNGARVDADQQVTAAEQRQAVAGGRVPGRVGVVFGRPICLAAVGSVAGQTWSYAGGTAVFAGIPAVIAWAVVRSRRRQRRLVETGTAVGGEVTAAFRGRQTSAVQTVAYRFATPAGPVEGKVQVGDSDAKRTPVVVGLTVTVLYDPGDPRRNTVYEWSDFEVSR